MNINFNSKLVLTISIILVGLSITGINIIFDYNNVLCKMASIMVVNLVITVLNCIDIIITTAGPQRENFPGGTKVDNWAPKSYWAPQALTIPMPLNHFLSDGCRSSFRREGATIFAYRYS